MTATVIAFPPREIADEFGYDFTEDHIQELTWRLQMGNHGGRFNDAELAFIEQWGGEDSSGTWFDSRITNAYGIEQEDGSEPGQFTWPKLVAILRKQKRAKGIFDRDAGKSRCPATEQITPCTTSPKGEQRQA